MNAKNAAIILTKGFEKVSSCAVEPSQLPPSSNRCSTSDQDTDDSDSEEIFRVKRRSSVKVEKRTVDTTANFKAPEQQV